ncbi:MAG: site-specific integrase [Actinobacteria bacterium]|nr:site-specific integrase [Actinomycetota bacterium]
MGYGDGTIVREVSGRYRGARTINGTRVFARGATRKEVRDKLRAREAAAASGLQAAPSLKLGEVLEAWLEEASPNRARVNSSNTIEAHRWAVDQHLVPNLGSIRLQDLTREHIERAFKSLAKGGERSTSAKGLGHDSLVKLRATLHMALDWAIRRRLIRWNSADGVEIPKTAKPPVKRKSLSPDQVTALMRAAADDKQYGAVWVVMLAAGLRPGEVTGLSRESVDLEAGVIHVVQSLARVRDAEGHQLLRPGPVKASSRRSVAIPPVAVTALREHLHRTDERRALAGDAWTKLDWDPAFTTTWGTPVDPSNLRRLFRKVLAATGIEGHWTPYELRHTSISLLSDAGVDKRLIADAAGHRTTRMVDLTYRHALRDVHEAPLEMERFLNAESSNEPRE